MSTHTAGPVPEESRLSQCLAWQELDETLCGAAAEVLVTAVFPVPRAADGVVWGVPAYNFVNW